MRCNICKNYDGENCIHCSFEYDENASFAKDDWDILNLKEEDGWEHIQILDRLHYKNIECIMADIWYDNNLAYLIGCKAHPEKIARALNIHSDVIYNDQEHGLFMINLFQEKYIRGLLNDN